MSRKAALIAFVCFTSGAAKAVELEPYQWTATLENVLDEIAQGSDAAQVYLPTLIRSIAEHIDKTEAKVLLDKKNVRAVLIYALSGGDGKAVRRLLSLGGLTPIEETIAKGALAYSEGKYSVAAKYLGEIDARSLDVALAPRVALTQAIIVYKSDPEKAIKLLDLARLLGAATLIEEAAIRRQIALLGANKNFDRFEFVAARYFRKHEKSVYSGYFSKQFSLASSSFDFSSDKNRLERLKAVIELLQEQSRKLSLYLLIAENAIGLGNVPLAKFAAENGQSLSTPASSERLRADLYLAAASVASDNVAKAIEVLESMPRTALSSSDAALRDLALQVGTAVALEPHDEGAGSQHAELEISAASVEHDGSENTKSDVSGGDPIEDAARNAIESADKILRGDLKWKAQ